MEKGWCVGKTKGIRLIELDDGEKRGKEGLFVCLVGFLTPSSKTRLYRGLVPGLTTDNFTCCHTRDRGKRGRGTGREMRERE